MSNSQIIDFTNGPGDTGALRSAFARFTTGVTIVSAHSDIGVIGMTANSFASVSLDPPLLLWCPAKHSRRHDAFVTSETFAVHILSEDQHDLAVHFASEGRPLQGSDISLCPHGLLSLPGSAARFTCQREAVYPGGDHSIVVGKVLSAEINTAEGLIFHKGDFWTV